MRVDLSEAEVFADNEINFDKKITFIFGKNGSGKSTLTGELRKLSSAYEVHIFQGFANLIDKNQRLNAVVLGEENAAISRQIEIKKEQEKRKKLEIELIKQKLQDPKDEGISNFWTRRNSAQEDYKRAHKNIEDFCSRSAAYIKNKEKPRVALTTYDKRDFKQDIVGASRLSDDEVNQCIAIINSEVKIAPEIVFPKIALKTLEKEIIAILNKKVMERVKISRIDSNPYKREFAKKGLALHQKGDICSFCGNKIADTVYDELSSYFSVDEVRSFQDEIHNKCDEIDALVKNIKCICIDSNNFYPTFFNKAKEIGQELEERKKDMLSYMGKIREALDEKFKFLFEVCPTKLDVSTEYLNEIEKKYQTLRELNNKNNLAIKQEEAKSKLRKHYVKVCLDDFKYDVMQEKLNALENRNKNCINEYNSEEEKITGDGGLNDEIKEIQNAIKMLQNNTKNESLLAENINKKLRHMVSFELVHVDDEESRGFYRVKNSTTGEEREVTALSTGEKNVIAFLYFIEKLDEIKDEPSDKSRIIVFDDPMNSNDDSMQYLIIEELQKLMKQVLITDRFILLTHNKHFYLNVKYGKNYKDNRFIRFQSDGKKVHFIDIKNEHDDYKTSYESLWCELKFLYRNESVSADLLLNPIRRIIETYTKFNAIKRHEFCNSVDGAMKLFNVNSHSIDDVEAELNGKTKKEIIQIFYDCFSENHKEDHFFEFWGELKVDDDGKIIDIS